MKYFTSKLFERLNSSDEDERFAAWAKWDQAAEEYRSERSLWLADAPKGVHKLVSPFCGHDAEIIGQSLIGRSLFSLFVVQDSILWMLSYQIVSEPLITPRSGMAECWSDGGNRLWLYDELSQLAKGRYRHEILTSDGSMLQIDFSDVQVRSEVNPTQLKKYDFLMEFTVTARDLKAAFRRASLVPAKTQKAVQRKKSAKKTSAKTSAKHSVK